MIKSFIITHKKQITIGLVAIYVIGCFCSWFIRIMDERKTPVEIEKMESIANENGYLVEKSDKYENLINISLENDILVQYWSYDTFDEAIQKQNEFAEEIKKNYKISFTYKMHSRDYEKFKYTEKEMYQYIIRVDNTLIITRIPKDKKRMFLKFVKEINY